MQAEWPLSGLDYYNTGLFLLTHYLIYQLLFHFEADNSQLLMYYLTAILFANCIMFYTLNIHPVSSLLGAPSWS